MKFKIYDLLSQLIPGFLVYIGYLAFMERGVSSGNAVADLVLAFVIGYLVNAVASWLEDFFNYTWGGKPSTMLIKGKDIWKVRFYESNRLKENLLKDADSEKPTDEELFAIAQRVANSEVDSRVNDFNASYAFSRAVLTAFLILTFEFIYLFYAYWQVYVVFITIVFIAWLRCKQKAYYYAREVLNAYLRAKEDEDKTE